MKLSDVKIEPFEDNWKDWFIVDEPGEKIELTIFFDKTYHFYVNPKFQRFKFTGTIVDENIYCSKLYYIFSDENPSIILNSILYNKIIDPNKSIGECIIER